MMKVIQMEYRKLIWKKKNRILLMMVGVLSLLMAVGAFLLDNRLELGILSESVMAIWQLDALMAFAFPLVAVMAAVDMVSGEFQKGSIINTMLLPVEKHTIYLGKMVSGMLYLGTALGVLAVASITTSLLIGGMMSGGLWLHVIRQYIEAWMILGLMFTGTAAIAVWLNTSTLAFMTSILLSVGFSTAGMFIGKFKWLLPTTYFSMQGQLLYSGVLLYVLYCYIILVIAGMLKFQTKEV